MSTRYAIVTPVRDEEKHLEKTIASVLTQDIKPQKWIIIDDGSTDRTCEIIKRAVDEHEWITGIETRAVGLRKPGGESVLPVGMQLLNLEGLDFFVRMDGDLDFDAAYFRRIFEEFDRNPKLGIASGVCYVLEDGRYVEETHPLFHTRGPIKTYRQQCFRDIGGLDSCLGWDTIDEVKANMLGWQTRSFADLKVIHLRKTQTASGVLTGMLNRGRAAYYAGYHPLFMLSRASLRALKRPYIIGGVCLLAGYLEGYVKRLPTVDDQALIRYLRKQQLKRLLFKDTIWV